MKIHKVALSLILVIVLSLGSIFLASASNPILLYVNGQQVAPEVAPEIINGITMVPIRVISEALGANVEWNNNTQTVNIKKDNTDIYLSLNNSSLLNGKMVSLETSLQVINGRVLVPVRFVSEALGCKVNWDESTRTVTIVSTDSQAPNQPIQPLPPSSPTPAQVTQALQIRAQIEQGVADAQQKIGNLKALAQQRLRDINNAYDPSIQNLKSQEQEALREATNSAIARGIYDSPLRSYETQKIKNLYDPQIKQLQNEKQSQIDSINKILQDGVSQLEATIAGYQDLLQQLNSVS